MTKTEDLERVLQTEAALAEALARVVAQKQEAIVGFKGEDLGTLTLREEELVKPLRQLEEERVRIASDIAGAGAPSIALRDLTGLMTKKEADRIAPHAARLRTAVQRVVRMNDQNRVLLQQSLRYVRETLRIITDNHTKQLIDQKM